MGECLVGGNDSRAVPADPIAPERFGQGFAERAAGRGDLCVRGAGLDLPRKVE